MHSRIFGLHILEPERSEEVKKQGTTESRTGLHSVFVLYIRTLTMEIPVFDLPKDRKNARAVRITEPSFICSYKQKRDES